MHYRGYEGSVEFSEEDRTLHGRLEFIRDLVTFEGRDVDSLETAFREAVDDYLDLCREEGRTPDQPFKGTFNVRTGADLHRKAAMYARQKGLSLNKVVVDALESFVGSDRSR